MRLAKWGNSLAIRIPATVIDALDLKEGDDIDVVVAGKREFGVERNRRREEALQRIRNLRKSLPKGFVFDREEANAR